MTPLLLLLLLLLPLNCPPLTAHLLLRYLSISGEDETSRLKSVRTGISLLLVFFLIQCFFFPCSSLSKPMEPLSPLRQESGVSKWSGSGSQVQCVAAGFHGEDEEAQAVVSAGRWGWAASCSVRCCAASGTLSGRPASPPPPPDWSPLCGRKQQHICNITEFVCLFMDKAGDVLLYYKIVVGIKEFWKLF